MTPLEADGSPKEASKQEISFEKFRQKFDQAEKLLKEVEEFCEEVAIPAINELRYAGHHLSISITNSDELTSAAELEKAINHCRRASYDAASAGIAAAIVNIEAFKEEFSEIPFSGVISNWSLKMKRINEIRDTLPSARTAGTTKGADYELQAGAYCE